MLKYKLFGLFLFSLNFVVLSKPIFIPVGNTGLIYFIHAKENTFNLIQDSCTYVQYNMNTGEKIKKSYTFLSDETFEFFRNNYLPVFKNPNDILFIDHGCGRVYKWTNDSIYRIDKSFHHKNQHLNATIYHDGNVYLYGGYGFFQAKNITTTYNKVLNEWFLYEVHGTKPYVTPFFYSFYSHGVLTVFNFKSVSSKIADVYELNINQKKWNYLGRLKAPPLNQVLYQGIAQRNLDYLITEKSIVTWDLEKRQLNYFRLPIQYQLKFVQVLNDHVLVLGARSGDYPYYFLIYKKDEFVFPKVKSEQLINSGGSNSPWLISGGIGFIIGLLVLIGWRFKRSKKRKVELSFTKPVFEVLNYWITNENFQIELSELNDFVDYDNPSMETLKKRREMLLKCIKLELQDQFPNIGKDPFEISSHHQDRRIKVLTLNRFISDQLVKGGIREK
jgi:hypothetical protein